MRYTALVFAAFAAACTTKQQDRAADRTADSAAGGVRADSDVAAQGGSGIPAGYTAVPDESSAKLTSVRYLSNEGNWDVTTGPAHIIYAAKDTASGTFTASAGFQQLEAPRHPEAYCLIDGGRNLGSADQSNAYFLVRGNGQYLIKSRQGATTKDVVGWTANPAVPKADSAGKGTYRLSIQSKPDSVRFLVNDKQVAALKAGTVATNGVVGLRNNHNLHVLTGPVNVSR